MGRAITGAAELLGAVGMGTLAFFDPAIIATPYYTELMGALALGGLSMEAGAIASALTGNRGQNITTRQPASFRQIIYGTQRVGAVEIYRSTTGSHHDQFNYVCVIATHECWAIENLYLDGRQVFWDAGSPGHSTRNGYGFGGNADGGDHIGPNGQTYNFGGKVYCEARYGDQLPGDVITGLTANDPTWAPSSKGSPYVGGCTYVYLKIEYAPDTFPAEPEIRFTVKGKPIYDPRSGTTAHSHNPALIINDVLTDAAFGLGDSSVNQAQLIAAANICEEQVPTATAGHEDRYACHWHYDTSTGVGDIIQTLMDSMGARISRIEGQWYIFPAAYLGPSASFNADHLVDSPQWTCRSYRDLFNRVTGTYTAPNYPYNVTGDLYDANGWYDGTIQNNFPYAFQQTNYPYYACDSVHGYASDEFLNEDDGVQLPKELGLPCVLSVSQAQRLAKIALLRNRQLGSGTLQMSLQAFVLQPCDTFNMTFNQFGWAEKLLEVNSVAFAVKTDTGKAPQIMLTIGVNETDSSVYEWSTAEELTPYVVPANPSAQAPYIPAAPTNMVLTSSAATALLQPDGTVVPRIEVQWDTPLDIRVTLIQLQYQLVGASSWIDGGSVDVSLNVGYLTPVVSGLNYNVRIRSVRANGATSSWVQISAFTASIVLSTTAQAEGIGVGSLVGEAYADGTAAIDCQPFTALLGGKSLSYFQSGTVQLTGLAQQNFYYVYVVDSALTGGNLTPIATQNRADYLGKLGYFLIDTVTTPFASSSTGGGGSGARYVPSSYQDYGSRTTSNPTAAYDGDTSTCALVSGNTAHQTTATGDCLFQGDPAIALPAASTLTVVAAVNVFGQGGTATATGVINGTAVELFSLNASAAQATYTCTVPANTPLNTISVEVTAQPALVENDEPISQPGSGDDPTPPPTQYLQASVSVSVYEIYVQA